MKVRTFAIILAIGLVGAGIWTLIALILNKTPVKQSPVVAVGGKNEEILGTDKIFFPGLVDDGKAIIGLTQLGTRLTRIDLTKNTSQQLSSDDILAPQKISYAPDGSAAIVYAKQADQPAVVTYYNFKDGSRKQLDSGMNSVVWSADSQTIYYLFTTDAGTSLAKADPVTMKFSIILANLPFPDMELALSPGGRYIAITRGFLSGDIDQPLDHPLYLFDLKDDSLHQQKPAGLFAPVWAPSGNRLAYLHYDPATQTAHVVIYDVDTQTETASAAVSLPGDFAWRSPDELIVASPASPTANDLTQGFPSVDQSTVASVSQTGKVSPISTIDGSSAISDVIVSPDGKTLYFRRVDYERRVTLP